MLARVRDRGAAILCDACQIEITDNAGVVLWKVNGPVKSTVLVVHKHCEGSSFVKMLLPHGHRQQALSRYLEDVLEDLNV
jgi:hypothetical protein